MWQVRECGGVEVGVVVRGIGLGLGRDKVPDVVDVRGGQVLRVGVGGGGGVGVTGNSPNEGILYFSAPFTSSP